MSESSNSGVAVIVELILGMFTGIMGVGHIFAGSFGNGILIMLCFWAMLVAQYVFIFIKLGPLGLFLALLLDPVGWLEKILFSVMSAYSISVNRSAQFANVVFWITVLMAVFTLVSAKQAGATIAGM